MMGAAFSAPAYQRVGANCDACAQPKSGITRCSRCRAALCRTCFTAACTCDVGLRVGLPLALLALLLPRYRVCDGCRPDEEREEAFSRLHAAQLTAGASVVTFVQSLLSDRRVPAWVSVDLPQRKVHWKSLELVRQEAKEAGTIALDEVAGVQTGPAAASAAKLTGLSAAEAEGTLRLVDGRGHSSLVFTVGADTRAFTNWSRGLAELQAVSRMPHARTMPTRAAVSEASAGASRASAIVAAALAATAADRSQRAGARAAFRESLGPPSGLAHTAAVLTARGGGPGGGRAERPEAAAADLATAAGGLSIAGIAVPESVTVFGKSVTDTLGAGMRSFRESSAGGRLAAFLRPP